MGLRNAQPVKFSPVGLSDALDSSNVFPGAMAQLQNLIPDVTTRNVWTCRPAATPATTFSTFTTPGFISVIKVIGTRVYGMIASGLNAGHDEPFIFDMVAGTFVAITGITAANTPVSPATSGEWTPPTMDLIGSKMIVTHPGYTGGAGNYFGWFDISTFATPAWSAGNTATNALAAVPSFVRQFGQRAYFIVNGAQPALVATDVLDPLTRTNPTYVLTFGDTVPLVALEALPLNSQLTGGILQSLIVFKQSVMYQVTGDFASTTSPTTVNGFNVNVGTLSPNAIAITPKGVAFIAIDGVRVVNFQSVISDPVGFAGGGVTAPFVSIQVPSRATMACNADTVRVSLISLGVAGNINVEYWYTISRGCWSGPQTCNAALLEPYNNTFVASLDGVDAKLFQSDSVQTSSSTFVENGTQLTIAWQPSIMPDNQQMNENNMLETTINLVGSSNASTYNIQAINSDGTVLDTVVLSLNAGGAKWGAFIWGGAVWSVSVTGLSPVPINWHNPIVFRKLTLLLTGNAYLGFKIGDLFTRMEQLGYLQMVS
jgi:hypothetical protein